MVKVFSNLLTTPTLTNNMKTKTATAAAAVIATADLVQARDLKSKSGKASSSKSVKTKSGKQGNQACVPNLKDTRYGATCVEENDHDTKCENAKGKGITLYYDGEDKCVESNKLKITACDPHYSTDKRAESVEEFCTQFESNTEGCQTREMCEFRHLFGGCPKPDKEKGDTGCGNCEFSRGVSLAVSGPIRRNLNEW